MCWISTRCLVTHSKHIIKHIGAEFLKDTVYKSVYCFSLFYPRQIWSIPAVQSVWPWSNLRWRGWHSGHPPIFLQKVWMRLASSAPAADQSTPFPTGWRLFPAHETYSASLKYVTFQRAKNQRLAPIDKRNWMRRLFAAAGGFEFLMARDRR